MRNTGRREQINGFDLGFEWAGEGTTLKFAGDCPALKRSCENLGFE
jgi:hypothetical protein